MQNFGHKVLQQVKEEFINNFVENNKQSLSFGMHIAKFVLAVLLCPLQIAWIDNELKLLRRVQRRLIVSYI